MNRLKLSVYIVISVFFLMPISQKGIASQSVNETIKVEVYKKRRILVVKRGDFVIQKLKIALGRNPVGPKKVSGDNKTPEGEYTIDYPIPVTEYYKAFHISYPTQAQVTLAKKEGKDPGGGIWIHGIKPKWNWLSYFHTWFDWTHGCIGVSNENMDLLYKLVPIGTKIIIYP
jgi:murein L,D-transpeptidase YafK